MNLHRVVSKTWRYAISLALVCLFAQAPGCGLVAQTSDDSESHFLAFCEGSCGAGLSCICGVCTLPCSDSSSCGAWSSAGSSCDVLGVGVCPNGAATLACDVECQAHADCATLSDAHDCVNGRCRRPASTLPLESDPLPEPLGTLEQMVLLPSIDDGCCLDVRIGMGDSLIESCTFAREGVPVPLCTSEWTACNDPLRVDGADVLAALQHPDVLRSVFDAYNDAPSPPTFGWNGPETNATSFSIDVGFQYEGGTRSGINLYMRSHECSERVNGVSAPADCVPMPEGVRALKDLLATLKMQQLSLGSCTPDRGCYANVGTPCEATPPYYSYDASSGSCIASESCPTETSTFPNLLACALTCENDPCRAGELLPPGDCSGVNVADGARPAADRCFENATQACLCACTRAGAPIETCSVTDGSPQSVSCDP